MVPKTPMWTIKIEPHYKPPTAMPTCKWQNVLLYRGTDFMQDLSALPFAQAYKSIYAEMSFLELAELISELIDHKISFEPSTLLEAYKFRLDAKTEKVLLALRRLPQDFYAWAKLHSLSAGDLYSLCNLPQLPEKSLSHLAQLKPSRSFGIQLLDLLVDCQLMNLSEDECLKQASTFEAWRANLHTLRFPQTTKRDEQKKEYLLGLWPKSFTVRWLRQGDRAGVDVHFFVSSKKELAEKIESLQRVHNELAD